MNRSGNKNSYFRQIAMPQDTGLPVLRPARRWPTRPGEERPPVAQIPQESKPSNLAAAQPPRTNPATEGIESRLAAREPKLAEPSVPSETPEHHVPGTEPEAETVERRNLQSLSAPDIADIDNIVTVDGNTESKHAGDRQFDNSSVASTDQELVKPAPPTLNESRQQENRSDQPRAIENITQRDNGDYESDNEPSFDQTTQSASPNRESRTSVLRDRQPGRTSAMNNDRRPANIHIGSIEVRVVNPAPVQQPAVQNRPPVQLPRNGAGGQSSGKLARAFRGPFGLRQE